MTMSHATCYNVVRVWLVSIVNRQQQPQQPQKETIQYKKNIQSCCSAADTNALSHSAYESPDFLLAN